jgi:hypothetical protein
MRKIIVRSVLRQTAVMALKSGTGDGSLESTMRCYIGGPGKVY